MPRVELLVVGAEDWYAESDNGSSTHDLCHECVGLLEYEEPVPEDLADKLKTYNGEPEGQVIVGELGVEHPPYDDDDYECAVCRAKLTDEGDGSL